MLPQLRRRFANANKKVLSTKITQTDQKYDSDLDIDEKFKA